jgi:Asp-tRNA(Asn)/Glu-tRNA(Gln) amidotransferase A subunit family amidase
MTRTAQSRLEACYEAMKAENPRINAVIDAFNDLAIPEMADSDMRAEDGATLSPIDGLPIGVKANIAVQGGRRAARRDAEYGGRRSRRADG